MAEPVDVVVVGGGHNGLVCAAYLARAGLDVTVVERNSRCGGVLFNSIVDGVTLEHGGIDHSTILASPVPDELDLAHHGLEYIERTASAVHLFGDGARVEIAATAEQTASSIAAIDEHDAEAWLELSRLATALWTLVGLLGEGRALPLGLATRVGRAGLGRRHATIVELATMPATELADRWFRSPHLRAITAFRSQFSGLPATHPGTGAVFCLTPGGHGRRYGRPRGGSAAFVGAIEGALVAAGGEIRTGFDVAAVERTGAGWTVRSVGGDELRTRMVVSAIPPHRLVLDLIRPSEVVPARLRRAMARAEVVTGNLSQFTIAAALDDVPVLPGLTGTDFEGSQLWFLTRPEAMAEHQRAAAEGRVADEPAVLGTVPSVLDPTAAPPGRASLWINGFVARRLRQGSWRDARSETADRVWSTIDSCLPGLGDRVTHSVFTDPDELSARTRAENPGIHLSTTLDQSLSARPAQGFADHRAGAPGLYLTGAGTNPGPSISGMPGRACARAVLADIAAVGIVGRARRVAVGARRESSRLRRLARTVIDVRRG